VTDAEIACNVLECCIDLGEGEFFFGALKLPIVSIDKTYLHGHNASKSIMEIAMPAATRSASHRKALARQVGRPPKYTTPEDLEAVFEAYFARQDAEKRPYTVAGLCLAAGFSSRQSLYDYEGKEEYVDTIKRARLRIEEQLAEKLVAGQGMVAGPIFALKNHDPAHWRDKHETEVSGPGGGPVQVATGLVGMPPQPKDIEEWAQWYARALGDGAGGEVEKRGQGELR